MIARTLVLAIWAFLAWAAEPDPATLVIHPGPPGVAPSPLWRVAVAGREAFVLPIQVPGAHRADGTVDSHLPEQSEPQPAGLCSFDFSGRVEVAVSLLGPASRLPLRSVTVRPLRQGIVPVLDGDTLRFSLDRPAKLSIEVNGNAWGNLHLFAGRPEVDPPRPGDPSITHYFAPGIHDLGVLDLPDHARVYLAGGALVRGHLHARGRQDIRISGRGILDSSRSPGKRDGVAANAFGAYANLMRLHGCREVVVSGIHLLDSPSWSIQVVDCERVELRDLRVFSWRENGDGIDISTAREVTVTDCFVRANDDALLVKGHWYDRETNTLLPRLPVRRDPDRSRYERFRTAVHPARGITFADCVVWCDRANALHIGYCTSCAEIAEVAFRDIDVIHDCHDGAITIVHSDRAPIHAIRFEGIRLEDHRSRALIGVTVGGTYVSVDRPVLGLDYGPVTDLLFRDIVVTAPGRPGTVVFSAVEPDSASRIAGVRIEGLVINGVPMVGKEQLGVKEVGRVSDVVVSQEARP